MDQLTTEACSLMEIIIYWPLKIVNFDWTDSVFLNGWLTVSEAANCLTDLGECFSDSDWLTTYMYIAAVWMTKELSNLLTLLVDWQCGVLFIAKEEFFCWIDCVSQWLV